MRAAASLPEHACWRHIAPLLSVEVGTVLASSHQHRRIELDASRLSEKQFGMLLGVLVRCPACNAGVCPFRRRFGKSAGRAARPGRLFVALACPLDVNIGCSRGKAASEATEALAAAIRSHQQRSADTLPAPSGAPSAEQLGLRGLA
jgi:hypothetical protein